METRSSLAAVGAALLAGAMLLAQTPQIPNPGKQLPRQPGQEASRQEAPQDDQGGVIFRDDVRFVVAPVTVKDKDGKNVTDLLAPDFVLLDNGKPQRVSMDVATHPISLVIAVQASAGLEKIIPQVQKIGPLISTLVAGESGEVAVLSFDHRIQTLTPFTSDPLKIDEAIKKLKPGSTSARLNDATMEAVNLLRNRPPNRKRILLLISESRDNGSEMRVREVLTAQEFANIMVFSVNMSHLVSALTSKGLPPRPNPIPPEARTLPGGTIGTATTDAQMAVGNWTPVFKEIFTATKAIFVSNPLEVYTKYTGGREHNFVTQKGLEEAVADIGEELHSQYLLTYQLPPDAEGGFHEIEVRVRKPGLEVRTRNGFWIAGPAAPKPERK
jgi:VWFA-related protein